MAHVADWLIYPAVGRRGCARFLDSPYVQIFCGESHFQHALPLDRSSMTRWRKRVGAEQLELLLAETLAAAERTGAAEPKHFERVTIDTTVQPKAVTHPTDSKLIHRGVELLGRLARRHGVVLRQPYTHVSRCCRDGARRLRHAARPHRLAAAPAARGPRPREDLRAVRPGGGAHRQGQGPHPLRVRLQGLSHHHQPHRAGRAVRDRCPRPAGQSLRRPHPGREIAQTEHITGVPVERAYVDRGYRGHDADKALFFLSGQKRGVTPTIRREIRRRAGIEPVIGHMKVDGHLGRNLLAGASGDAIKLTLAAAGHNLRLLRSWLIRLLALLLSLLASSKPMAPMPSPQLAAL
ncbi:MAG TPA: IS5/IS1182 family transposase [Falsiroseomonas sp.]|jgi:IS5 family transposase|nr:IS5/IS1182 family transposase [Falsiroseomonas sp.]